MYKLIIKFITSFVSVTFVYYFGIAGFEANEAENLEV